MKSAAVFWRIQTVDACGSYSRPATTIMDVAREVLSAFQGRTLSLRLSELEYNEDRTAGGRIVQDLRVRARDLRRGDRKSVV